MPRQGTIGESMPFGAVLESALPSFCLSYKIQCQETTVTALAVLAVSAVVAVLVVTAVDSRVRSGGVCA